MSEKNMLEGRTGPVTQSVESVKNLLAFVGRASDPLPSDVTLDNGRLVLILSNKKDAYYVTTPKTCSCPAATYHPGQLCKHARKYFPQPKREVITEEPTEGARRLARPPEDSIRPNTKAFRPFDTLPCEEKAFAGAM